MSVLDWFRPKAAATLREPEWWRQMLGGQSTGSGVNVTPDSALQISAVYACVRILAETVASLPLRIYQRTGDGRVIADHPLNNLLGHVANGEQTAMELREGQMASLGLRGNAYTAVIVGQRGQVGELVPLLAKYMNVDRDKAGRLVFDYQESGYARQYSAGQIWRIAALGSNGVTGLSPVALARESMGLAVAAERSASRLFSNGQQTSIALEYDHELSEDNIARLRTQWADQYAGWKNAHKPIILESGMKVANVGMTADDAQFLESRKWQIAEVARWFRVPLHMLNELDRATFSNIEHQSIEFVMHTVRPWLVRIEQTIARDLLTPTERAAGLYASHTVEGLLRGDTAARFEAYGKAIKDGWLNRNEVREKENLNAVDGLDEYLAPLNMAPAAALGEATAPANRSTADVVAIADPQVSATQRLASAENDALRKEAGSKTPEEFAAWVIGFYDRQAKRLEGELSVDAGGYKLTRLERMTDANTPLEAAHAAAEHTLNDIEALSNE